MNASSSSSKRNAIKLAIDRQDFQKEKVTTRGNNNKSNNNKNNKNKNHSMAIDTIMDLKLHLAEAMSTIDSLQLRNQRLERKSVDQRVIVETSQGEREQLRRQLDTALSKLDEHRGRNQHLLRQLETVSKERNEARRQLHNYLGYGDGDRSAFAFASASASGLADLTDTCNIIPLTNLSTSKRSKSISSATTCTAESTASHTGTCIPSPSTSSARISTPNKEDDNASVFSSRSTCTVSNSNSSMRSLGSPSGDALGSQANRWLRRLSDGGGIFTSRRLRDEEASSTTSIVDQELMEVLNASDRIIYEHQERAASSLHHQHRRSSCDDAVAVVQPAHSIISKHRRQSHDPNRRSSLTSDFILKLGQEIAEESNKSSSTKLSSSSGDNHNRAVLDVDDIQRRSLNATEA